MITSVKQQPIQAYSVITHDVENGKNLPQTSPNIAASKTSVDTVTLNSSNSVNHIAQQYDVRNMTPREMSQMSLSLYKQGNISFEEHALLSFQPELMDLNVKEISLASADQPKDFIAHWEEKLAFHQQRGETEFAKNDKKILNILKNLESLAV